MKNPSPLIPSLPTNARSPINRCNLPAVILGSRAFQDNPAPLVLDGVQELHVQLFDSLATVAEPATRALYFADYMGSCFLLDNKEEAGFDPASHGVRRHKADYRRLLRGWMFSADSVEGAVLKRWVESRFGLLARNHGGPLRGFSSRLYERYQADYMRGLYNSNALESQLDLLYSYCQYELQRQFAETHHWTLYRGVNRLDQLEILHGVRSGEQLVLLNNINSFTRQWSVSDAFGDSILKAEVPLAKIFYFPGLLPHLLRGEEECLVIGGVYGVEISRTLTADGHAG